MLFLLSKHFKVERVAVVDHRGINMVSDQLTNYLPQSKYKGKKENTVSHPGVNASCGLQMLYNLVCASTVCELLQSSVHNAAAAT